MKATFAELPALQKARRILELQEQIKLHKGFCTDCLRSFNYLFQRHHVLGDKTRLLAEKMQVLSEWHAAHRFQMENELKALTGS